MKPADSLPEDPYEGQRVVRSLLEQKEQREFGT